MLQCGDSLQAVQALSLATAAWAAKHGHSYTFSVWSDPGRAGSWCKIHLLHATVLRLNAAQDTAAFVLFLDNDAVVAAAGDFMGGQWLRRTGHSIAAVLDDGDDIGEDMTERLRDVFRLDPSLPAPMLRDLLLQDGSSARGLLTHDFFNTGVVLADASSASVDFFARLWEEGRTHDGGKYLHGNFRDQRIFNVLANRFAGTPDAHLLGILPGAAYNSANGSCIRHFYSGRMREHEGDILALMARTTHGADGLSFPARHGRKRGRGRNALLPRRSMPS